MIAVVQRATSPPSPYVTSVAAARADHADAPWRRPSLLK